MRKDYSEFYTNIPDHVTACSDNCCEHCGMTCRYLDTFHPNDAKDGCVVCAERKQPVFKGLEALKKDIDLQPGERIGVTTSGGKDSIHALMTMTKIYGKDRVVALTHHKAGLTDPVAEENLRKAVSILGTELITVEEKQMQERFRRNLSLLIRNPDPALVRVVLCAGCRYGITEELYRKGVQQGIRKYVSAASYLELAPFKEELLAMHGEGDADRGFEALMQQHLEYNYGDNLFYIRRDNGYKYKSNRSDDRGGLRDRMKEFQLFDLDNYLENDPQRIEETVSKQLGWQRHERSWHFDCIIEEVKDMFYYGMLGFTESDFKLAGMVHYGLLSREEVRTQLAVIRNQLEHSYPKAERFFIDRGLADCIPYLKKFYRDSRYLCDPEEASVTMKRIA